MQRLQVIPLTDDTRPAISIAEREHRARQPAPRRARQTSRLPVFVLRGALVVLLAGGIALAARSGLRPADWLRAADAAAIKIGLGINQVSVTGSQNALSDDIFNVLDLEHAASLLSYDTAAARARLEALPWVDSARLARVLPDSLDVTIRERKAFAVWQHKQLMFLVDAQGRTLEPTARADHLDLPLVVGDDADASARDLMQLLARFPAIANRLDAAVRVGGRRWDLRLKNALTLMLPEDAPGDALAAVARMDSDERVFERRLSAIDLRVAGRVAFQVMPLAQHAKPGSRIRAVPDRGA